MLYCSRYTFASGLGYRLGALFITFKGDHLLSHAIHIAYAISPTDPAQRISVCSISIFLLIFYLLSCALLKSTSHAALTKSRTAGIVKSSESSVMAPKAKAANAKIVIMRKIALCSRLLIAPLLSAPLCHDRPTSCRGSAAPAGS